MAGGYRLKLAAGARRPAPAAGVVRVNVGSNNVVACCADCVGNVLAWASAGERGFKGAQKASPFATQVAVEAILRKAGARGVTALDVEVSGRGANRDVVLKALQASGLTISVVRDVTPVAHNGCRPPKTRRV